jgi:hypothetical protein
MFRCSLAVLLLLGLASSAPGNPIPVPRPRSGPSFHTGPTEQKLVVEINESAKQPRLLIPKNLLLTDTPAEAPRKGAFLGTSTLMAGLALSLACVTGGLWIARRGKGSGLAALCLGVFALAATASSLSADIPAPKPPAKPPTVALPADIRLSGRITVLIVEKGDSIKLVVNKSMLGKGVKSRGEGE